MWPVNCSLLMDSLNFWGIFISTIFIYSKGWGFFYFFCLFGHPTTQTVSKFDTNHQHFSQETAVLQSYDYLTVLQYRCMYSIYMWIYFTPLCTCTFYIAITFTCVFFLSVNRRGCKCLKTPAVNSSHDATTSNSWSRNMWLLITFAFVQFSLCSVHWAYRRIAESIDVRVAMLYMFLNPVSKFIVLFYIFFFKTNKIRFTLTWQMGHFRSLFDSFCAFIW